MAFCNNCGRQNPDDAKFCSQCAAPIVAGQPPMKEAAPISPPPPPSPPSPPSPPGKDIDEKIGREMGAAGERMGKAMNRFGEQMGKDFERFGIEWGDWFNRTFGVLMPLLGALFGLVLLIIVIAITRSLSLFILSAFLITYLFVFFLLMVTFGYSSYVQKKFRKETRWTTPITTAIGLAIAFWILSEVHYALWHDTGIPGLDTVGLVFRVMIFVVLVLVTVIGYVFMYVVIPREHGISQPPPGRNR